MSGYQGYPQGQQPGGSDEGRAWAPRNPPHRRYNKYEKDPPVARMAKSAPMSRGGGKTFKRPAQYSGEDFAEDFRAKRPHFETRGFPVKGQGQDAGWRFGSNDAADRSRTLFVFNLMLKTSTSDLFNYFVQFGDLVKFTVFNDDKGKSTGTGMVQYTQEEAAMSVLDARPHFIQKKQIIVSHDQESDPKTNMTVKWSLEKHTLYVSDIPLRLTEQDMCEYFSQWGNISFCDVAEKAKRTRNTKYGFISYTNFDDAVKCLKASHSFGDSAIYVHVAAKCTTLLKVEKALKNDADIKRFEQMNPLFVTNIPDDVTPKDLADHFSMWGKLNSHKIAGKVKQNNNFGFVSFEEQEDALKATIMPHTLNYQRFFVRVDERKSKRLLDAFKDPKIMSAVEEKIKNCYLFVPNLNPLVTKEELNTHFKMYGSLASCMIIRNGSRLTAFLAFVKESDAARCLNDVHVLNNEKCFVRRSNFTKWGGEDLRASKGIKPDVPAQPAGFATPSVPGTPADPNLQSETFPSWSQSTPEPLMPGWKQADSVPGMPLATESAYECNVSGCSFKGKSEQFQRHWTKIHEAKALYLICSFCAMGCVDPDDLREHLEFFHGVEDRNEISTFQRCAKRQKRDNPLFVMPGSVTRKTCMKVAMSPQEKGAEGFYNCTECTFTGSVNEFLDHWDKQHFSGLGYLKCPKCPQTFMMKDFLLIHIKNQHQNTQQGSQTLNLGRSMLETTMPRTALSTPLQPGLNVPRPQQPVPGSLLASQMPIQQAVPLHGHGTPFYPSTVSVPKPLPPHPPFLQPGPQSGPQPFIQPALQTAHQPVPQPAPQFVVTSVTPTVGTPLQLPLSGQMITQSASAQPPQFVMEQPPLHITQCYPSTEPVPKPLPRPPLPPHILQTAPHSVPQPASDQPLEFVKKRPPVASPTVTRPCEDPSSIPELDEQDLIDVDMGDIKPQEKENLQEKSPESRSEPEMVTEKKANEELKRSIQPGSVVALRPEWTKTLKVVHPKKVSLDKNTSEAKSSFTTQVKFIPEFDRTHIDTVQKFLLWSHIMMERLEDANIQARRRLEADSVEGEDYEDPEELLELSSDEETEDGKSTAVKGTLSQAHEDMKARAQTVAQKVVADYRRTRQFMKGVGKQGLVDRKVLGKLFYTAIGMIKDQSKRENMDADLASKGMSWVKQDIRRMLELNQMMQCETVEESEKASVSAKLSDRSHSFQQRTVNVDQSRKKHQQRTDNIRVYGGETRSGLRHINDEDVQMHDRGQGQFFEDDRLSQEGYLEYRHDDRTRFSNARNSSVNIRRNEDEWSQSFVTTKSQRTDGKQIDDGDYHGNLRNQSCGDKASSSKSKSQDLKEVVDTKAKDQMGNEKKREGGNKTEGNMFQCEQDDISEGDLSGDGSPCEFDMDDFDMGDFDLDDPDKGNYVVMDEV